MILKREVTQIRYFRFKMAMSNVRSFSLYNHKPTHACAIFLVVSFFFFFASVKYGQYI